MNVTELLVYSIVSAAICGLIAESKKRDRWPWIVAGFLFGIIAIVAALATSIKVPIPEPTEPRIVSDLDGDSPYQARGGPNA